MGFYTAQRLFELLPAHVRVRDATLARQTRSDAEQAEIVALEQALAVAVSANDPEAGALQQQLDRKFAGPLRALLEIVAEQIAVLEEDLEQLEDDQFIETCAEWVVPYIGELVGVTGLIDIPDAAYTRRGQVANALGYRRRKGTAAVLEQLARDVTGWPASVRELFQHLVTTQYMNHVRPASLATLDLRRAEDRPPLDGPFGIGSKTIDVRRATSTRTGYNIPNVAVFLWRVRSMPWREVSAFRHDATRFSFHPLGFDIPLYNDPQREQTISQLATTDNVPRPLRRREIRDTMAATYGRNAALAVFDGGVEIPLNAIELCDLGDWNNVPAGRVAVDPERGRFVLPNPQPPGADIRTSFRYGFAHTFGGGEYARVGSMTSDLSPVISVSGSDAAALQQALDGVADGGVVEIADSGRYGGAFQLTLNDSRSVELRSAERAFATLRLGADLTIVGGEDATVTLNGLLLSGGSIRIPAIGATGAANRLSKLRLEHCTAVPGNPSVSLIVEQADVTVEINRSIVGAIRIAGTANLEIGDSIVDAQAADNVALAGLDQAAPAAPLIANNVTFVGKVRSRILTLVSNAIFVSRLSPGDSWGAPVQAERLQQGCVRFSHVPLDSQVPRRHRCTPAGSADAGRVQPDFCSLRYGDPAYALLDPRTVAEIRTGADDGVEMGAFHDLRQAQREAALHARLREHLRFGLDAGVSFAS